MKIGDLLELALRNIRESRLRNALTAMGIAVGVASLVSMLSLGIGLQRLASNSVQRSGLFDTLTVTSIGNGGPRPNGPGRTATAPAGEARVLDDSALLELEKLPEAREVYPNLNFAAGLKFADGTPRNAIISGIPASAKESDAFASIQGTFFSSLQAAEVMLPKEFAAELLGVNAKTAVAADLAKQLVGKKITLSYAGKTAAAGGGFTVTPDNRVVEIVGIVDRGATGGQGPNNGGRLFVPLGYAEGLHVMQDFDLRDGGLRMSQAPVYSSLVLRLKNPSQAASAETAIKKMGFNTFSVIDATSSLRQVFAVVDLFLGAFGSLALAVASIGIVNTLVMAILERRREIGIMKAVGASDIYVRMIFLAEAAVLGLTGGILGVAMGWSIGKIINFGANIFLQRQGLSSQQIWFVPWWLVGGALAFSVVASLLSGAYPAARAARLDPVEALRYE
jgi:putative ABC transport system permease protein